MEPKINLALQVELLVSQVYILKLDGNSGFVIHVQALPDLSKSASSQFLGQLVLLTNNLIPLYCHYNFK